LRCFPNLFVIMLAHYHDPCGRERRKNFSRGCDAVCSAHFNVHHNPVGPVLVVGSERLRAITAFFNIANQIT
jgi:hypothetical protein